MSIKESSNPETTKLTGKPSQLLFSSCLAADTKAILPKSLLHQGRSMCRTGFISLILKLSNSIFTKLSLNQKPTEIVYLHELLNKFNIK